jgi:hypothetical protein
VRECDSVIGRKRNIPHSNKSCWAKGKAIEPWEGTRVTTTFWIRTSLV